MSTADVPMGDTLHHADPIQRSSCEASSGFAHLHKYDAQ